MLSCIISTKISTKFQLVTKENLVCDIKKEQDSIKFGYDFNAKKYYQQFKLQTKSHHLHVFKISIDEITLQIFMIFHKKIVHII